MKLIDADALAKKCCINREEFETCEKCIEYYVKKGCSGICYLEYRGEDVQNAPTIDAIPVEWLNNIILNGDDEDSKAAWRMLHKWNNDHSAEVGKMENL